MFHDRLRSARIYRGYTLQKTADSIGIPLRALQKYESGEIEPNLKMLTQFADLFDVPADFFLGRDDYPLMYPKKVLQGVPNLKRAANLHIFNLLIVAKCKPQLVRQSLLREAQRPPRSFQIVPHLAFSLPFIASTV